MRDLGLSLADPPGYLELCIEWRIGLSDEIVRSLASDYLRGMVDPCTQDAFNEYERRWGPHHKGVRAPKASKKSRRPHHR